MTPSSMLLKKTLLASAIATFASFASADGFSLLDNTVVAGLAGGDRNATAQVNGSIGTLSFPAAEFRAEVNIPDIAFELQADDVADGTYGYRLGLIMQDQDSSRRLEANLGGFTLTVANSAVTAVARSNEDGRIFIGGENVASSVSLPSANNLISPDDNIINIHPEQLIASFGGNHTPITTLFNNFNDAGNYNIRLVLQPLDGAPAVGVRSGGTFTALPRMQTNCPNSPHSTSSANFTFNADMASQFSSAHAISGILQLGDGLAAPGAAFALLSENCETQEDLEPAPPSPATPIQNNLQKIDELLPPSDAPAGNLNQSTALTTAANINNQMAPIANQLSVSQSVNLIDALINASVNVAKTGSEQQLDLTKTENHLIEAQKKLLEEIKRKQQQQQQQALLAAQQKAMKESMDKLLASQKAKQSQIQKKEDAFRNQALLGKMASLMLDLDVKLDDITMKEYEALLAKWMGLTEQQLRDQLKDFDKDATAEKRKKLSLIEQMSAKIAFSKQYPHLKSKLAANSAAQLLQIQVAKFDNKVILTNNKFSDTQLIAAMKKRLLDQVNDGNIMAATADPEIERDPDSGEILLTMPGGEQFLTQLTAVRFLPGDDLDGWHEASNGAHIIYTNGLALDLSAIPVNTEALFSSVLEMGYVPSLRDDGVLTIDLGNNERFAGAFGLEDIRGGNGECTTVTLAEMSVPFASGLGFVASCNNGVVQHISPAIDDQVFYAYLQEEGLQVTTNRVTGVIHIEGVGSFRPDYFVTPLTPADNNLLAFNGNPWDLGLRAVDANNDGVTDYEFVTRNGVQLIYGLASGTPGEFAPPGSGVPGSFKNFGPFPPAP